MTTLISLPNSDTTSQSIFSAIAERVLLQLPGVVIEGSHFKLNSEAVSPSAGLRISSSARYGGRFNRFQVNVGYGKSGSKIFKASDDLQDSFISAKLQAVADDIVGYLKASEIQDRQRVAAAQARASNTQLAATELAELRAQYGDGGFSAAGNFVAAQWNSGRTSSVKLTRDNDGSYDLEVRQTINLRNADEAIRFTQFLLDSQVQSV